MLLVLFDAVFTFKMIEPDNNLYGPNLYFYIYIPKGPSVILEYGLDIIRSFINRGFTGLIGALGILIF